MDNNLLRDEVEFEVEFKGKTFRFTAYEPWTDTFGVLQNVSGIPMLLSAADTIKENLISVSGAVDSLEDFNSLKLPIDFVSLLMSAYFASVNKTGDTDEADSTKKP